jgi:hypothetical protein
MKIQSRLYVGRTFLLASKHQKAVVVAPAFKSILDVDVNELPLDTDLLGTFSGEIERKGTAKETVLAKARMAIAETGNPYALASEGSIGADPFIPFINSDFELMAFVDDELGLEVIESIRSTEIVATTAKVKSVLDIEEFLRKADFPNHKVIVRSPQNPSEFTIKGIDNLEELKSSLTKGFESFPELILESDLRAHCSPSRMANIGLVARKLAIRLSNHCPECQMPGWGVVGYEKGVPCSECEEISEEAVKSEILGCAKCAFTTTGTARASEIDPSLCNYCNP